jgi:putative redox protein
MSLTAVARSIPGTLRTDVLVNDRFHLVTDEPVDVGGDGSAPAPHELFPAALASCIATTLAMYARTKGWDLGEVVVDVDYDHRSTPRRFEVEIRLGGDLSDEQLRRLEKVAEACPVRRAVEAGLVFEERIRATVAAQWNAPISAPPATTSSAPSARRRPTSSVRRRRSSESPIPHSDSVATRGETTVTRPR